jgi:hypothetical protein
MLNQDLLSFLPALKYFAWSPNRWRRFCQQFFLQIFSNNSLSWLELCAGRGSAQSAALVNLKLRDIDGLIADAGQPGDSRRARLSPERAASEEQDANPKMHNQKASGMAGPKRI